MMLPKKEKTVHKKRNRISETTHSDNILHYSDMKKEWKDIFEELEQEFVKRKPEFPSRTTFGTTSAYGNIAEQLNLPLLDNSYTSCDSPDTVIIQPEIINDLTCDRKSMKMSTESLNFTGILKGTNRSDTSSSTIMGLDRFFNVTEEPTEILETDYYEESMPYTLDDLSVQVDEKDLKERKLEEIRENEKRTRKWKKYDGKQKAILKFLKLPEKKAASWRPQTESTAEEFNSMSLPQRAAFVENMVASEFCEWLDSLGGIKSDLNETTLKELFQIGLINPASHSMASKFTEKSCIPDSVAKVRDVPKKSFRHGLLDHLAWDVYAKHLKPKKLAFNKLLPPEDRVKPSDNNSEEEWLTCKTIPQELISFHTVFADILHLRSLEAFCQYISKKPLCVKPHILVKKGFFHKTTLSSRSTLH